jgi:hypothetical protein
MPWKILRVTLTGWTFACPHSTSWFRAAGTGRITRTSTSKNYLFATARKIIMKAIHVIPLNDREEHYKSMSCNCSPQIYYPNDDVVLVVHDAYDGRDIIDELVEELSVELNYGGWGLFIQK